MFKKITNYLLIKRLFATHNSKIEKLVVEAKHRNALSHSLLDKLIADINLIKEKDIRVLIITSSFDSIFSSGHDLREFVKKSNDEGCNKQEEILQRLVYLTNLLQNLSFPVIAEVRGHAAAAGCQLVAACDIVTASENAKFSTPGVKNGIFCSTPGTSLYHNSRLPPKQLACMLFTGEPMTAKEALTYGLVSKIFPDHELIEGTLKLASQISRHSREVVALGKKCLYEQMRSDSVGAYKIAVSAMVANLKLDDAQEGIKAFLEKRTPVWKD